MITYDKKLKSFILTGKNFTYAMYVNRAGFLQNLYYGAKIADNDAGFLIGHIGNTVSPDPDSINMDMSFDGMPSECGFYGRGDYREPTVLYNRSDGSAMSRFRYLSYRIYCGVPEIKDMPHSRRGGQTLEITLKDDFSPVELVLNYTVWDNLNTLVRNIRIKNAGSETLKINRAFSFCTELPERNYRIMRLHGNWAKEREVEVTPLGHGITRLQTLRGVSSHQLHPFMGILAENCAEETGDCYGVQLVYSGNYALTAEISSNGFLRLQGGINDFNFNWHLASGEYFETPQAVLCYSSEGVGGLSRSFSDFLREQIIAPDKVYARRPIVVNNWEATYFDFDSQKLFNIIDEAAALGIDTFVLDDGWFGKRDDDNSGLGDWYVNQNKLNDGLKAVIDRCKQNGLKFGLWFEPEMISEDSDLFRSHPDWAVCKIGTQPARGRNQLVLDMTRSEIVDYIFNAVSKILLENDISYVKWDFNRTLTEFYSQKLPADRQGEFAHRFILGTYKLAERLTTAFPEIFFEGCAGGGGRFDAGVLYYFPQIWTSDDTDGYERTKIQWGTSICYPVSAMSCHVSVCPNHQTQRITPFNTRGVIASLGATGYEIDLSKISEQEKEQVVKQIADYKKIDELVLKGDLYRLSNPFTDNYFCVMIVGKDKMSAYVAGERFRGDPADRNRILKLNGLAEDKTYIIEELGITASGKALCCAGILFPRLPDYGAWTWHIKAVK